VARGRRTHGFFRQSLELSLYPGAAVGPSTEWSPRLTCRMQMSLAPAPRGLRRMKREYTQGTCHVPGVLQTAALMTSGHDEHLSNKFLLSKKTLFFFFNLSKLRQSKKLSISIETCGNTGDIHCNACEPQGRAPCFSISALVLTTFMATFYSKGRKTGLKENNKPYVKA